MGSEPQPDDAFAVSREIKFESPDSWHQDIGVYVYDKEYWNNKLNVEFFVDSGDDRKIVDAYLFPEDLERLGILLQYVGKTAKEARDGTT